MVNKKVNTDIKVKPKNNKISDIDNNLNVNINMNNKFIKVNTKRKRLSKNIDLNKLIYIQNWWKKIYKYIRIINITKKIFFIRIIKALKNSIKSKSKINKSFKDSKKFNKNKNKTKKKLTINTNIYDMNKMNNLNKTEAKEKEKISSICRTSKHNKIISYINYKLNLIENRNNTNINTNINNEINHRKIPFSPKINSIPERQGIHLNKIKYIDSTKKIRNKNIKNEKNFSKYSKTITNTETSNTNNNMNTNLTLNLGDKIVENKINKNKKIDNLNININISLGNENNSLEFSKKPVQKYNNYTTNFPKLSKIRDKGLLYNFQDINNNKNTSKEIKNKQKKNKKNNYIKTDINKINKVNNNFLSTSNKTLKPMNNKINNNKNNNISKIPLNKKKKKENMNNNRAKNKNQNNKIKNNNKIKSNFINNSYNNPLSTTNQTETGENNINIIKKYFLFWNQNSNKYMILKKILKFSKLFKHMNEYKRIILLKNNIQKLIQIQKNKNYLYDFFCQLTKKIFLNVIRKVKEYKKFENDINNICLEEKEEIITKNINSNDIKDIEKQFNQLKIVFNILEKHYIKNNSNTLLTYFKKWKLLSLKYKFYIKEKIIDFKPKLISNNSNNIFNDSLPEKIALKKNLSSNKISPKIINVINVQNYNENNNYNYNFKYLPIKEFPIYSIKPQNGNIYTNINLDNNINNINSPSNIIYKKKKLGSTHIKNKDNINFNNNVQTFIPNMNCFSRKFNINTEEKFDGFNLPFQNNSEILSLENNYLIKNEQHPEIKFGFKKKGQIEEKEIKFYEINSNNKLYIKKQNCDKKNIFLDNHSNIKNFKNTIKSLNIQFDNNNENRFNKIFSSKNIFTEAEHYDDKNNEDKINKSLENKDINSLI